MRQNVKPTQEPVPSSNIKDLFFNSGLLDIWATSLEHKYIDRFGNCHLTAAGMEWLFKELVEKFKVDMNTAILAAGYITIDSFQQGADLPNNELTQRNHILRDETTGEYYRWDGDLPKQVTAGSTPQSTGGIGKGAWVSVGDASLRSDITNSGGAVIGTFHRQNLKKDLDAIDRRPDGYDNNIHAVLENGQDVEVNKDYQSATQVQLRNGQVVKGAGGSLKVTSGKQSAFRVDVRGGTEAKDHIVIRDVRTFGSVSPDDNTNDSISAYSVFLRDNAFSLVSGLYSSGFTGGVALINTRATMVENIVVRNSVYNPALVRGAYAVFLDECKDTIVNGVHFTATGNNDGRHLLYVSNGAGGSAYNGCVNIIATNLIANYQNKDNRDMWAMNYRKSRRTLQNNFIIDGANGGVAYNPEQGDIEKNILVNGHIHVLKYNSNVGVYGVSQLFLEEYKTNGFLASNLVIEVKPKNSSITSENCIGFAITGRNGMLNGIVTNVPRAGNPILILNGATNVLISNVVDYTNDGSGDEMKACITFGGDAGKMSNITVRGIKTSRRIFDRITAAVNVTVDFPRSAIINLTSGVETLLDDHELISSVSIGNASITVVFHDHVTQSAVDMVSARMRIENGVDGYTSIMAVTGKSVTVRFHQTNGTVINPSIAAALSCQVTLYS